jgi:hypothetical protein
MTASTPVPKIESLLSADREAVDALLQCMSSNISIDRHKQVADNYGLQQCLLNLAANSQLDLINGVNARLEALETLSPRQYAAILLSEKISKEFLQQKIFRPELAALLQQFLSKIAANALKGNGWLYNAQHPLRRVCNQIYHFACGWHNSLGRAAETSLRFLQSQFTAVQLDWDSFYQNFTDWLNTEQLRIQKLEQRLIASEVGAMKARRSRQLAIKTLNQLLSGKKLPPAAVTFFHGPWLQSLQLALVQGGERSELWFRQRKLTETVIWSLQPIKDDTHRQQLFRVVGQIGNELRDTLVSLAHQQEAKDEALAIIEQLHLQLVQNMNIDYADVPVLESSDVLLDNSTSISRTLLAKVEELETGIWFDFPHQTQHRRLKLLIKLDESQQLLFVNQIGMKALEQSFEEFAYQLASGGAVVLTEHRDFDACVTKILTATHAEISHAAEQTARTEAENRIKMAAEQRARELARIKAEEEAAALQAAKEKADAERRESELLAEQEQRAVAIAAQDADDTALQQRARLLASSLTIGTWAQLRNALGEMEKLKLAVILPSSGKCIFVDRNGIKKLELTRDELIQSIMQGNLDILHRGQQFEDSLARVVGSLRRDKT